MVFYTKKDILSTIISAEEALEKKKLNETVYVFETDEEATETQIQEAIDSQVVRYELTEYSLKEGE